MSLPVPLPAALTARSRPRPAGLDGLLSLLWVLIVAPLVLLAAVLEGFLCGEHGGDES